MAGFVIGPRAHSFDLRSFSHSNSHTCSSNADRGCWSPATWHLWTVQDALDDVDQLLLLPERALSMDSGWLQADLAELKIKTDETISLQRSGSLLNHPCASANPDHNHLPRGRCRSTSTHAPSKLNVRTAGRGNVWLWREGAQNKHREEKVRTMRERQAEERQKKLEELKQHAQATQKFREQQEEERRKRAEEQRLRDAERRSLVEERKRILWEVERERRESILRKNQDRDSRLDGSKRRNESSHVFAFGSSTPRMLEPGTESLSAYWSARRATSTTNVMSASAYAGRTSAERDVIEDGAVTKRATSVFALDKNPDVSTPPLQTLSTSMYQVLHWESDEPYSKPVIVTGQSYSPPLVSVQPTSDSSSDMYSVKRGGGCSPLTGMLTMQGWHSRVEDDSMTQSMSAVTPGGSASGRRRRTDIFPTMPSPRDGSLLGSTSSARHSLGTPRTPGRTVSLSRLDQLAQPRIARHQPPLSALHEQQGPVPTPSAAYSGAPAASPRRSMSQSMSHLASTEKRVKSHVLASPASSTSAAPSLSATTTISKKTNSPQQRPDSLSLVATTDKLKRGDRSRSLTHLVTRSRKNSTGTPVDPSASLTSSMIVSSSPGPKMTRAERLRVRARELRKSKQTDVNANGAGFRSGEVTPLSPTRPLSAMSQQSGISTSSSIHIRSRTAPAVGTRRPRPVSMAGTGVTLEKEKSKDKEAKETKDNREEKRDEEKKVQKEKEIRRVQSLSASRPSRARSADAGNNVAPAKKTEKTDELKDKSKKEDKPKAGSKLANKDLKAKENKEIKGKQEIVGIPISDNKASEETGAKLNEAIISIEKQASPELSPDELIQRDPLLKEESVETREESAIKVESNEKPVPVVAEKTSVSETPAEIEPVPSAPAASTPSTASRSKPIITSEEEAKAALAEKRRLAREQMEREAELERQRKEAERLAEEERIRREELEQKLAQEEQERLLEEARKAEQERLEEAIKENERRAEEEKKRKEEDIRLRQEKEEVERKSREEAEKLRKETEERLKKEEEERQERRKRVEAIMSRTRGKTGNTPSATPTKATNDTENKSEDAPSLEGDSLTNSSLPSSLSESAPSQTVSLSTDTSLAQPDLLGDLVGKVDSLSLHSNGSVNGNHELNGYNTDKDSGLSQGSLNLLDLASLPNQGQTPLPDLGFSQSNLGSGYDASEQVIGFEESQQKQGTPVADLL